MNDENEKLSSKLYFKVSILIFLFFIIGLGCIALILTFIYLTGLAPLFIHGLASGTFFTLIIIYLASTILASFLSYFIAKRFMHPLVELSKKSIKVSKGDFSVRVNEESSLPELKNVLQNFNIMVKELSKVETLSNDFVANVSHEFKTPLAIIRSNINILENTNLTDDERSKCLIQINDSTEKLSTLISNVLKICKLDNQEILPEKKNYRLDEQLRQSILFLNDEFEKKNIDLDIDLDDCCINNDPDLLEQVWINLLTNAIKFSYPNGTIKVHLKIKDNIMVSIKDNGIGMDEETQKHIFDRFYQGETSHTKDGNGLGLTIVSKIIRLCNAKIDVKSKENEGTEFIVLFSKKQLITSK